MIYHLNIVLIYIFAHWASAEEETGGGASVSFARTSAPRPPTTISQTNKIQKLQNPTLPRQCPKQTKKLNIEKMQNPALPRCFFDTLDTVDMVYTVYTIQTALHCLNSIMYIVRKD